MTRNRLAFSSSIYSFIALAVGLSSMSASSAFAQQNPALAPVSGYADIAAYLRKVAADHPDTSRIVEIGQSDSGDMIIGLEVSKPGNRGTVNNLVVGTHHGNEYGSTEVAKAFAASIAEAPIPGQTVYVIPVLNVSGYNQRSRYESAGGRSFDPNRDYPGPCGTAGPFKLKSTAALAKFIDQKNIVTSATLHTFYPAVVYPWGIPSHDLSTPYDDLFKQLTQAATVESKYQTGNSTDVIYPAAGCYEDYAYWKHGIWSLLFEMGGTHSPNSNQVAELVRVNVPGLRRFLEQAPRQRADKHSFEGKCDVRLLDLDRHDE